MSTHQDWLAKDIEAAGLAPDYDEAFDLVDYDFRIELKRREFLQILGAGLMIAVAAHASEAQQAPGGRRGGGGMGAGAANVAARVHIGQDGSITVLTGKVECGQGARAELTQAAAEELRVPADRVRLIMADTGLVPDDGGTFGSRSTPATVPAIRRGCAAARELLAAFAARKWGINAKNVEFRAGRALEKASGKTLAYADLASDADASGTFSTAIPADVKLTPVDRWEVLGKPYSRPNGRDVVTGSHRYPSDITRPGLMYGKVLRQPSYGAKLVSVNLGPAKAMQGVTAVRDGDFVGVVAPSTFLAEEALEAVAGTARWQTAPHPSSGELYVYLRQHVRNEVPKNPFAAELAGASKTLRQIYLRQHVRNEVPKNPFAAELAGASKTLRQTYHVAYVQHCPMEPRAAVAEWADGKLTVWTGSQVPFGVKNELVRAFGLADDRARVIVPDFGGGFGGKHSGECAVEAARLARAAGRPVRLVWTRPEEFTWAQFRPAAVIDAEASLDASGKLTSWHFLNLNSGNAEVQTPYRVTKNQCRYIPCDPPLRHGSYRALAATANTFGRESFMDELAALAGQDPLEFRLAHLDNTRLRAVLEEAAKRFNWPARSKPKSPDTGVGLACGTDKGSFVAACVEVAIDRSKGTIAVKKVCQAYECGKILNPSNLRKQVEGGIIMGLGPALREESRFEGGKITNASFGDYRIPRFADVPELDIHLLDRPDLPSAGAGETPLIAVAPAIANAVFAATGVRVRSMPIRLPGTNEDDKS